MSAMKKTGVYIHIPFCAKKCPYCDFYSRTGNEQMYDDYTDEILKKIAFWSEKLHCSADTLYFGGGTPSLIGAERLNRMAAAVREVFGNHLEEITAEVNPAGRGFDFSALRKSGFNRISVGLQSANDDELSFLGRLHTSAQAADCIHLARAAGFDNISLDLMIALPGQTKDSLRRSVEFCVRHDAKHISAYILKIEPGTVFYKNKDRLNLPDDDEAADRYEYLCGLMREYGYEHYEISNFCKSGYESRHNLKYWHDEEYIGIGPSAHSFIDGRRFYYPKKITDFIENRITDDGDGGNVEEFIMLGLRLSEGITNERFKARFDTDIPKKYMAKAKMLEGFGLTKVSDSAFSVTEKGFMVSNVIISEILN
ncbi:MAG: radical SAM family heme chaperone HemW [Clostridia bacterium]|nr:radical SAM family heme chaperone HemW [Clostridia bacterium]